MTHHVVIVGGGFAGLNAARALRNKPVRVTLIDRCNYHLFQPLLYQVATGSLSPANIAAPLREVLRAQRNTQVLLADVVGFDPKARKVLLADGEIEYDSLVLASGAGHSYFGNDHWSGVAPGLKTVEDATEIRARLLEAFEAAERCNDADEVRRLLTFVVVGAGPTGVELAGSIAEMTRTTLKGNFRNIDPADTTIYLVEGADRVLPPYVPQLSKRAATVLTNLGVKVRLGTRVTQISANDVTLVCDGHEQHVNASVVIWAAGVKASPLADALSQAAGAVQDRTGRVVVTPELNVSGFANIYVIGDAAHFAHQEQGKALPGTAPVAIQQGRYVGHAIKQRLRGKPLKPFYYRSRGSMATIGRGQAVLQMGPLHIAGYMAWMMWAVVHLLQLVNFENRVLVFSQWVWHYFTRRRSARLITRTALLPQRASMSRMRQTGSCPS